jgi:hypothetical protein
MLPVRESDVDVPVAPSGTKRAVNVGLANEKALEAGTSHLAPTRVQACVPAPAANAHTAALDASSTSPATDPIAPVRLGGRPDGQAVTQRSTRDD